MVNYFSRRTFVKATSGLLVGAAAAGSVSLLNSLGTAHAQTSPATWMANVGDATKISRLSIPGTHESCSLHGGPLTACQTMSLQEQLAAGIRFLDIRCRHINNVFAIHHGPIFQGLMFGGVRDVCINFLKAHPSECIVMSIKEEHNATGNTRTFEETFDSYVAGLESFWYLDYNIPTLKDVRGKIVLFARFTPSRDGVGPVDWQDNATFEGQLGTDLYEIQDEYKVPTILAKSINNKWTAIQRLLDRAKGDTSDTWYINFSSGASSGAYPNAIADRINPKLRDYIDGYLSSVYSGTTYMNKVGTLMMDFPSDDLINRIISAIDLTR